MFSIIKSAWLFCTFCLVFLTQACVMHFTNKERSLDNSYSKIYVPPVIDETSKGGASARLSSAIREKLALDTRFSIASIDNARWALDIRITNRKRITEKSDYDKCSTVNKIVGSGSQNCDYLKFYQADVSAEKESIQLSISVKAIDLNTGSTINAFRFENISSGIYPVVSDDTAIRSTLASAPQLHALRYVENVDNAISTIAEAVSNEITARLLNLNLKSN